MAKATTDERRVRRGSAPVPARLRVILIGDFDGYGYAGDGSGRD